VWLLITSYDHPSLCRPDPMPLLVNGGDIRAIQDLFGSILKAAERAWGSGSVSRLQRAGTLV
jgi:hypothetical protein